MKTFDCHSDILVDITNKRMQGEKNILKKYHIERLRKGNVQGILLAVWVDPPYTNEPTQRMLEILGAACDEFQEMKEYADIAYNVSDIRNIQKSDRLAIILGMEGLSGLKGNVSFLSALYRFGVRHAMLTWNEENEFATGVGSTNKERGVTELGVRALNKMEDLGILVDVSHGNEKTFWDIYENTTKPFIASHSDVYNICPAGRNLKDEQIKAIAERRGVIGMNAWPEFIDDKKPSAEKLADHIDYIANLVGIDYINFGFDFCDYLQAESLSFSESALTTTIGIEDASKIPNLLEILTTRGYKTEDIEKIAYRNIMRVFEEVLGN
ncbi:dipeptidase [Clostridium thailandense]|uniref:dipeptidase n=1 Tax=Clostridium thailandense TaxID=2794346 RepID=UPI00398A44A0